MSRILTIGILALVGIHQAASAQGVAASRLALRVGAGLSSSEYHCSGCEVDGGSGLTVLVAGTRSLGHSLTVGLEASASRVLAQFTEARLYGALATIGVRAATRMPVWATAGVGWVWYSAVGPNSNGPALSARAGVDVRVGHAFALTPYAGYLIMAGKDGPRTLVGPLSTVDDPGVPTRVASLQVGLAVTLLR
jgi:hypothetical protein